MNANHFDTRVAVDLGNDYAYVVAHCHKYPDGTPMPIGAEWHWGLSANGEVYFRGIISGFGFENWTKFGTVNIPMNERDVMYLASCIMQHKYQHQ